jgi:hypothetical protein
VRIPTFVCLVILMVAAPVAFAAAGRQLLLGVNDSAVVSGADVRCVVRQASTLTCGGRSNIYVQFDRKKVRVFRAVGPNAVFKLIYQVDR